MEQKVIFTSDKYQQFGLGLRTLEHKFVLDPPLNCPLERNSASVETAGYFVCLTEFAMNLHSLMITTVVTVETGEVRQLVGGEAVIDWQSNTALKSVQTNDLRTFVGEVRELVRAVAPSAKLSLTVGSSKSKARVALTTGPEAIRLSRSACRVMGFFDEEFLPHRVYASVAEPNMAYAVQKPLVLSFDFNQGFLNSTFAMASRRLDRNYSSIAFDHLATLSVAPMMGQYTWTNSFYDWKPPFRVYVPMRGGGQLHSVEMRVSWLGGETAVVDTNLEEWMVEVLVKRRLVLNFG